MNIKMPSNDERKRNIGRIVKFSLPPKRTVLSEIKRLLTTVGIKYAFRGVLDAAAAALLVSFVFVFAASLVVASSIASDITPRYAFSPTVFLAPVFYFSLLAFTSWKERMSGTWQLLTTCRYNLKYIAAIRVMVVSAGGVIFIPLATLPIVGTAVYLKILLAAFCSMFFYSGLTLFALLISESLTFQLSAPLVWIIGWGLSLAVYTPVKVESLLANVPIAYSAVAALVLLALYLAELRLFVLQCTRRFGCS